MMSQPDVLNYLDICSCFFECSVKTYVFNFPVGSLSIIMYSYNANLEQVMCHDVCKQVSRILA